MLDGIANSRIIVGAYTDRQGGVCPMLAAHRNGGRTSLASFARAWDRYTDAARRPRPATERELNTLRAMLEASIGLEEVPSLADFPRPAPRPEPTYPVGVSLARAVTRTLPLLPADSRCLMRSLVLISLLNRREIGSSLVIGVRPGQRFGAHAWVEVDGRPLLPRGESEFERLVEL